MLLVVPLASFEVEAIDVASILWSFLYVLVSHVVLYQVVERDSVDRDLILTSEVLQIAGKEGLGEEESREPVLDWSAAFNPVVQEINPIIAVDDPRSKRLHRQESDFCPEKWNLVVEYGCGQLFKLLCHHDFANKSTLNLG